MLGSDTLLPGLQKAPGGLKRSSDTDGDDLAPLLSLGPVRYAAAPASTGAAVAAAAAATAAGKLIGFGGLTLNLIYSAAALAAPAAFRAGIEQAATLLAEYVTDKVTVNLNIGYSGTGGDADAGPDSGYYNSYSSVRAALLGAATPGDPTFASLPNTDSIQGQSSVVVWNAQLKLFGDLAANDLTTDDGSVTFATDINPNLLTGVALHELTHAMGRVPYGPEPDIFDLFRFTAPGTRLFMGGATAPPAYFSLDNGVTKIADYGQTSDSSDFLNSGVQGSNDAFNEFYSSSTLQSLTDVDLESLDALGFHIRIPGSLARTGDRNGDYASDVLFSNSSGIVTALTSGPNGVYNFTTVGAASAGWRIVGIGDFNGDGRSDILWSYTNGFLGYWSTDASGNSSAVPIGTPSTGWQFVGVGDFNGDGKSDLLFRYTDGTLGAWNSSGSGYVYARLGALDNSWQVDGTGDFNGDGKADVLMQSSNGEIGVLESSASGSDSFSVLGTCSTGWQFAGIGDLNGDGKSDIIFQYVDGTVGAWESNSLGTFSYARIGYDGGGWQIAGTGDFNADGISDVLLRYTDGTVGALESNLLGSFSFVRLGSVDPSWQLAKT